MYTEDHCLVGDVVVSSVLFSLLLLLSVSSSDVEKC